MLRNRNAARTCCILLALTLCLTLFASCSPKEAQEETDGLRIVTTIFAPYDFARQIAGEGASVRMLLPPGSDFHAYEPTPQDVIAIQDCDLFIYVGGESDTWVQGVLDSIGKDVRTVTLMDCVEVLEEEVTEGMQAEADHGSDAGYDEHVWTSPRNAKLICRKIADALCDADPENAAAYEANLETYSAKLDELDAAFAETVKNGVRDTVVFADRFPLLYFARAYGLRYFAAYPGCAEETEPSAATVAFLIDKVRAESIPVVFHIELSNEDLADTIAEDTGAEKRLFSACHNVTKEQLDSGITYLDLMWANVDALKEALS